MLDIVRSLDVVWILGILIGVIFVFILLLVHSVNFTLLRSDTSDFLERLHDGLTLLHRCGFSNGVSNIVAREFQVLNAQLNSFIFWPVGSADNCDPRANYQIAHSGFFFFINGL